MNQSNMELKKKIFGQLFLDKPNIRDSKWCMKIFFYLHENGETRRCDLIKNFNINNDKTLYTPLKKLLDEKIVKRIPTEGKAAYYTLDSGYKMEGLDHLLFFEQIKNQEESIFYGDIGYYQVDGFSSKRFVNNHTVYGFPKEYDIETDEYKLTKSESQLLYGLVQHVDYCMNDLNSLKIIYELRNKIEKGEWNPGSELKERIEKHGLTSEKLLLHYLMFNFSSVLIDTLEPDVHNEKSILFLMKLMKYVCKLSKELDLRITSHSSDYPEELFNKKLYFPITFACESSPSRNQKEAINDKKSLDKFNRLSKHKKWLHQEEEIQTIEKLMKEYNAFSLYDFLQVIQEDFQGKTENNEVPLDEAFALLSTPPMDASVRYEQDVETRLNILFEEKGVFWEKIRFRFEKEDTKSRKVFNMADVITQSIPCNDGYSRYKFIHHNGLKTYFSEEEIKFMLEIIKKYKQDWFDPYSDLVDYIWYKGFEKEGLWYDRIFKTKADEKISTIKDPLDFIRKSKASGNETVKEIYRDERMLIGKLDDFCNYFVGKLRCTKLRKSSHS